METTQRAEHDNACGFGALDFGAKDGESAFCCGWWMLDSDKGYGTLSWFAGGSR